LVFFGTEIAYAPKQFFFSPYAGFFRPKTDDFSLSARQAKIMPDKTKIGSVYMKIYGRLLTAVTVIPDKSGIQ
jgi:hypothetical protein